MATKSDNIKGNPWHDESDGQFTSPRSSGDSEKIFSLYSGYKLKGGFSLDDIQNEIDSLLNSKPSEEEKKSAYINFKDVISSRITNSRNRKLIVDSLDAQLNMCPDNIKQVLFNFLSQNDIPINVKGKRSCFNIRFNRYTGIITGVDFQIGTDEILSEENTGGHKNGSTIVHELFHGINYGAKISRAFSTSNLISHSYILNNGKTLEQILREESSSIDVSNMTKELLQGYNLDLSTAMSNNEEIRKLGIGIDDITESMSLHNSLYKEQQEKLRIINKNRKYYPSYDEYVQDFLNTQKEYDARIIQEVPNWSVIDRAKKRAQNDVDYKYSIICDLMESMGIDEKNEFRSIMHYGHGMSYWKKEPKNQANEFLSEAAESMTINKESLGILKKYFPKSVFAVEEIIDELSAGGIK